MATKPITARRRLELSQLNPKTLQREVMNDDSGWKKLAIRLNGLTHIPNLSSLVTAAPVSRTIEGASTIQLEINDYNRKLLSSGLLTEGLEIEVDGLWFKLTAVDKADDTLTITFQDREIEVWRTYNSWKIAKRGDMTRAEFILSMIREVKEFDIPVVIPELHKVQSIEKYAGDILGSDTLTSKGGGIPKDINKKSPKDQYNHRESENQYKASPAKLTVKSGIATEVQIRNANIILAVGDQMGVSRRLKVVALMTAITETRILSDPGGPNAHNLTNDQQGDDSAGVFQQRPSWGSYTDRTDVETAARLFYKAAIPVEKDHPDDPYWVIAAGIQHPDIRYQTRYSLWRTEAERFVNAYGDVGTTVTKANAMNVNVSTFADTGTYYYYRGLIADKRGKPIRKPENSWTCSQRLADEVDWRSFFVSGTYYFISEADLLKQLPLAVISEFTPGIQKFNGNYDKHKKNGTIELDVIAGAWNVPPGGVVVVKDVGHPFDGRWIVNSYDRDLIGSDKIANVTLKKPRPALPEPRSDSASNIQPSWVPSDNTYLPPTKDLATKILSNKNIIFTNTSQTSDIRLGQIYDGVMQFMLWMANQGYAITVNALKSDHNVHTTKGRISAHSVGKAIDIGAIGGVTCGQNETTSRIMDMLAQYQLQLQFDQLIGPYSLKCIPQGIYDGDTLSQHRTHLHVGWPV